MMIKTNGEDAYFAASNSAHGFCSYYPACFDTARVQHIFAIKGGPGTGKSRFMRDVAESASGAGYACEYIYCSSDPDSLDGVILSKGEKCTALLDATAPHVYEPSHPGVREEIVNLGAFWNSAALAGHAERIGTLNTQKSEAYSRAYRYLAGAGKMSDNRDALVAPYIRTDTIRAFAERLMSGVKSEKTFEMRPALMNSIGMKGEAGFDTYFRQARKIYLIEDCRGSARYLTQALLELAMEKNLRIRLSHDPVLSDRIDGIYLCGSETAFAVASVDVCEYPFKCIRMRRFVDTAAMKAVRGEVNFSERLMRAMLDGAVEALSAVRKAHFQIEELYMAAMDFDAKENFTKCFCERLFGLKKA